MGDSVKDSSVITSISQLMGMEEQRHAEEKARREQAEIERARAEHEARLAAEARQREQTRRLDEELRRRREELAKLEAITSAEVQRTKLEAELRRQMEGALLEQRNAHGLEVAKLRARAKTRRFNARVGAAVTAAAFLASGWFGYTRLDAAELESARLSAEVASAERRAENVEARSDQAVARVSDLRDRLRREQQLRKKADDALRRATTDGPTTTAPPPGAPPPGAPPPAPTAPPPKIDCKGDPMCTSDLDL
jgi:colicin import membrane protein